MKLLLNNGAVAGEGRPGADGAGGGGRTVVVGVKLDQQSRELLTWAMVKVAEPGDQVLAVHVLGNNDIVDQNGKSSLLRLVRAFDSVLAVYEGFCNLKQVDLKLKICRGNSIRKILVHEAKLNSAAKVIVGVTSNHGPIGSPASVAKYCAKKLPKDCWVLAVNNGKIFYQKEGSPAETCIPKGNIKEHCNRPNSLLNVFHRTKSRNSKVLNEVEEEPNLHPGPAKDPGVEQTPEKVLTNPTGFDRKERDVLKPKCSICATGTQKSSANEDNKESSLAMVPSSSVSTLIRKLPEQPPGWPLLRRAVLPERSDLEKSFGREISVVQWAMRLPSRPCLFSNLSLNHREEINPKNDDRGALVLVSSESETVSPLDVDNPRSLLKELEGLHEKYSLICRLFKYDELVKATSNFLADNIVGKGGSSQVYKGCLRDSKEIAVKILKQSKDVLKEFVLEIEIITTLSHKNIISLMGFCIDADKLLLVYDLLDRGSLEENLYGSRRDPAAFGWGERYKVALGIAEALDYLHTRDDRPVIHRDVKSSNVLLSDDFEPQLSDFGLAKWASTSSTYITCTDVAGTFGYLAPEYFMYGKVNDKIDVYAFGVILLELLSGRKPISSDVPKGQESLIMWAKPILNGGKVSELLDPNLGRCCDRDQIERMVLAATLCVRRAPRARPQMSTVVKILQGDTDATNWARLRVSSSEESDLMLEDDSCTKSSIQSHINLALYDVEDDSLSMSIIEQAVSLEDYLRGRWSRCSSFD